MAVYHGCDFCSVILLCYKKQLDHDLLVLLILDDFDVYLLDSNQNLWSLAMDVISYPKIFLVLYVLTKASIIFLPFISVSFNSAKAR